MYMKYIIRKVNDSDAEDIIYILNHYITTSFAAYQDYEVGSDYFDVLKKVTNGLPFYVCEYENNIIGYAMLKKLNEGNVLSKTAEIAYYIIPEYINQGIGKSFLKVLEQEAVKCGIVNILANVCSLNLPSIIFHEKNGFEFCGKFINTGTKFGIDFDMIWNQKQLKID